MGSDHRLLCCLAAISHGYGDGAADGVDNADAVSPPPFIRNCCSGAVSRQLGHGTPPVA